MKTPTKDQINEILGQMQRKGWFWDSIDYEDEYAVLRFIITEWERIKEQKKMEQLQWVKEVEEHLQGKEQEFLKTVVIPCALSVEERAEELCKNNPGIKDFEDFNRNIRED